MPKKYREVIKLLLKYDDRFEVLKASRGKGSERMIYHPDINGRAKSYPIKCHGAGTEIPDGTLSAILRRFKLPGGFFSGRKPSKKEKAGT